MGQSRVRSGLRCIAAAAILASVLAGIAQSPASAEVTAVKGEACAYYVNVGLFGGPQTQLGCDELTGSPAAPRPPGTNQPASTDESYSPHVELPASGSGGSMTATDADGAKAQYGPATIHGGRWPCAEEGDRNCPATAPPSGPQVATTSGSPESGSVTSSAEISLHPTPVPVKCYTGYGPECYSVGGFGPFPVEGDSMRVECSATATSVTGSTTFSNAQLVTSTDAEGSPVDLEPVPDNPPPNYTRHGVITNVGDVFTVVYNEQIVNSDGSLTVIGTHMYLFGPTAVGEVVRGRVTCGTTPSAISPTDTAAPTCGLPVVAPLGPEDPTPKEPLEVLIGTFDTGGIQSVTDVQGTNSTVQVGNPEGLPYLVFKPGQTGPLPITATRTEEAQAADLPMSFSFVATDTAGNAKKVDVKVENGVPTSPQCPTAAAQLPPDDSTTTTTDPGAGGTTTTTDPDGGGTTTTTEASGGTTTTLAAGTTTTTRAAGTATGGTATRATTTTRATAGAATAGGARGAPTTAAAARGALARTGSTPRLTTLSVVTVVLGGLLVVGSSRRFAALGRRPGRFERGARKW